MAQTVGFSISFGYGLGRLKRALAPRGKEVLESKGYKIVNT